MAYLSEKLSDLCREQKQTLSPHKTNQDVAENTDLSVGTVSQFFRGDIKNPSVYAVSPICREMGVSIDDYFGIPHDAPAEASNVEKLRTKNAALRAQLAQQQKSLRMHRLVTLILLGILALCALALVIDVLTPSVGWFRG